MKPLPVIVGPDECPPGYEPLVAPRHQDVPTMPTPCHDCAFREGSPERADAKTWTSIMLRVDAAKPFFCHAGMPVDDAGRYCPTITEQAHVYAVAEHPEKMRELGEPFDARICAGWVRMRGRFLRVQRADLVDEMRSRIAEDRALFIAVDIALLFSFNLHRQRAGSAT